MTGNVQEVEEPARRAVVYSDTAGTNVSWPKARGVSLGTGADAVQDIGYKGEWEGWEVYVPVLMGLWFGDSGLPEMMSLRGL